MTITLEKFALCYYERNKNLHKPKKKQVSIRAAFLFSWLFNLVFYNRNFYSS